MAERQEDPRFVTGQSCFTDDLPVQDALHAFIVRSPHAHAEILSIDTREAETYPGVTAIYTGKHIAAAGLGLLQSAIHLGDAPADRHREPPRPLLALDRARFVGEEVAMVVAETRRGAEEAAQAVVVDYRPREAVVEAAAAVRPDAPQLWDDIPENVAIRWSHGDADATEAAFSEATHVISLELRNNRLVCNSLETRAAIGAFDPATGRYTLTTPSQGVHILQSLFAGPVFGIAPERLRVITPDVGGGFGTKQFAYREQGLVLFAARKLLRTVRWCSDRAEAFLSDLHARDLHYSGRLALNEDGRITAFEINAIANLGACLSSYAISIPTKGLAKMATGAYAIPALSVNVTCVYTNTVPIDAYRGAGKPEAHYLLERLMDEAAMALGENAAAFRQRHLITPDMIPYTTAAGQIIDSGNFPDLLDKALAESDWDGFEERRRTARARGRCRGMGLGLYVHGTGGTAAETARLEITSAGELRAYAGTQSSGQSHATTFAKAVADRLELSPRQIKLVQGDTDRIPRGGGSGGSSSLIISANSLVDASAALIRNGLNAASRYLEAAAEDIDYRAGVYSIAGTDRQIGLLELGQHLAKASATKIGLTGEADFTASKISYPAGVQIVELEVDPETGFSEIVRYISVDDIGVMIDKEIVAGQIHGGIAQGLGQAMYENAVYDPESGQMLAGSFMDYTMPRADDMPNFSIHFQPTATGNNPLGAKGVGECGTIGAPGAVMNALLNALRPFGVKSLDMPATPNRVWQALQAAAKRD